MKYALLITQNCNLACRYCYISKRNINIDIQTAKKAIDFIFAGSSVNEKISIGFFGGEPLLEFKRLQEITGIIENHPGFSQRNIELQVTSNGTVFSEEIARFLNQHNIGLGISCDGIPVVQNECRKFADGSPSSAVVERNIKMAIGTVPEVMVNAVFTPSTYKLLPESLEYFYSLGIRRIFINPDFSGVWQLSDAGGIQEVYNDIAAKYIRWHESDDPAFVSLIDGKIIVILNGGYKLNERCHMGKKEFAISPEGNIFPCERLLGDGSRNEHCIGTLSEGVDYRKFCSSRHFEKPAPNACITCSLKKYCMNWCGCSNYFSTGNYNQAGAFICISEKAAITASLNAFQHLEARFGASIIEKLSGYNYGRGQFSIVPAANSCPEN